jgi:HEAT repeat protein
MNPIPLFAVIACLLAGVCVGQEKKDAKIQDKPVKQWVTDVLDATQGSPFAAERYLAKIGPNEKDAVPELITLLADGSSGVRRVVCQTLGAIGPDAQAATSGLVRAFRDADEMVKWDAVHALARIAAGSADTRKTLVAAMKDESKPGAPLLSPRQPAPDAVHTLITTTDKDGK